MAGQYYANADGEISLSEATLAFGTGFAAGGQKLVPLLLLNTGNVLNTSAVSGSDPTNGLIVTPLAVTGGYAVGSWVDEMPVTRYLDDFANGGRANTVTHLPGEFVPAVLNGKPINYSVTEVVTKRDLIVPTYFGTLFGGVITEGVNREIGEWIDD